MPLRRLLLLPLPWLLSLLCALPVAALTSDDFFFGIDAGRWELVDPLGDATVTTAGAGTADARLLIAVPAGRQHDLWADGLNAPRLRQPCGTADFTLEVKFESAVGNRYQTQGILAEGAAGALRFEFLGDVSPRLFVAEIRPGAATTKLSRTIAAGAPLYLRVARAGSRWTVTYSYDGQTWISGVSFTTTLTMTTVAVYGGNAGTTATNAPAHTAAIDYLFDTATPIEPEDGGEGAPDLSPPVLSEIIVTPRTDGAAIGWRTDEPAAGEVEYGKSGEGSLGTIAAPTAASSQLVELTNLQPDTEYWFRIRGWDVAGNQAASGDHTFRTSVPAPCGIAFWYGPSQIFGSPGIAQKWVNILGDVANCPEIAALSYRVNGGEERSLSIGPDGRRLAAKGDFNADIASTELQSGSNQVEVIARDSYGQATTASVQIDWRGETWPLPYQVDWQAVTNVQDAGQIVDGKWQVAAGLLEPTALAYDRVVALGDIGWRDYEVTVPITVAAIDPAGFNVISNAPGVGVQLRWNGHTTFNGSKGKQPLFGWLPVGASAWYGFGGQKFKLLLNGRVAAEDATGRQIQVGSTWIFKLRVETLPSGEPEYRFKFWPAVATEPAEWDLTGLGYLSDPAFGSALLVAHHVDAKFGNVAIVPVVSDRTPPVVSDIGVTAGENEATVVWTTDEPARGEVRYGVSQDMTGVVTEPAFSIQHELTLPGLQPDTLYYFVVTGQDAAGNTAVSEPLTFRTAPVPVTYSLSTPVSGEGQVVRSPDQAAYAPGETVTLEAVPAPGWTFAGWSGDLAGEANPAALVMTADRSITATFVPQVAVPALPVADEFDGPTLNETVWTFVNPLGDAAVSVEAGRAAIAVPAGVEHDLWATGNFAPRLVQKIADGDFEVTVKFDSAVKGKYKMQGLVVEGVEGFLRFEFLGDNAGTRFFSAAIVGGTAATKQNRKIGGGSPLYLRLKRSGDTWAPFWSADGGTWTAGTIFTQKLTVATLGVYGGNAGGNPAHTALIDWFRRL